jgi:hypothetical protein
LLGQDALIDDAPPQHVKAENVRAHIFPTDRLSQSSADPNGFIASHAPFSSIPATMDVSDNVSPQFDELEFTAPKDSTMKNNIGSSRRRENGDIANMKELVDLALHFLSTCSNEMLLLVLAVLMGATYILLGRLGLIIIGIALGVVLHASWGSLSDHPLDPQRSSRRQLSLQVTHRLLDWQNKKCAEHEQNAREDGEHITGEISDLGFDPSCYGPATASALQSLVDAAIRDYVK